MGTQRANLEAKRYQAYSPANSRNVIQWQWPSYDPIFECSSPKLRCNGGTSATQSAAAMPGDNITAVWGQWTHSQGPIMVWLYKCPGTSFAGCDGSGPGWFKIDEAGFHGDGKTVFLDTERPSGWEIAKLVGGGKSWTSRIPVDIAPGNYLVRHELIALHQQNAPQFYPECAQIVIGGSGTALPDASFKAAIPGYCKQSDPNIRVGYISTEEFRRRKSPLLTLFIGPHQRPLHPPDIRHSGPEGLEGRQLERQKGEAVSGMRLAWGLSILA